MSLLGRREFVTAVGTGAVGVFTTAQLALGQTALPRPLGQHEVQPLQFASGALRGISEKVVTLHHDTHYAGYVKKRNAIEEQLAALGPGTPGFDARVYAGIKRDEAFNASGQVLHEVYFDNLGGDGQPGSGAAEEAIAACFGSLENWVADLTVCAAQATGWALLCYDPSDGRLHNFLVDSHQFGAIWGTAPVVALDVFEHAYYLDYGPNRADYIKAFFQNLHWGRLSTRLQQARGQ
jgi:superoxide dismutase, Fe-Mn family